MKLTLKHAVAAFAFAISGSPALADTVNSFWHAPGLPPLHRSRTMQAMAQRCANSMAARHSMDHWILHGARANWRTGRECGVGMRDPPHLVLFLDFFHLATNATDDRPNVFLAEQSGSNIDRFADIVEASRNDTEQEGLDRIS